MQIGYPELVLRIEIEWPRTRPPSIRSMLEPNSAPTHKTWYEPKMQASRSPDVSQIHKKHLKAHQCPYTQSLQNSRRLLVASPRRSSFSACPDRSVDECEY